MTVLATGLALSCHLCIAQELSVRPVAPIDHPKTFQRLEWRVDAGRAYDNPFDPDQIAIDAKFTGPGDRVVVLPAFWSGPGGFTVRFCAPFPGSWMISVSAKDERGVRTSESHGFDVTPSKNRGFVRRGAKNPRYPQFDSGEPYFMIGLNICWPEGSGLKSYEGDLGALSKAGGNFARLWMANPKMESSEVGLGRYDVDACAHYDRLMELAERNGIYCMLTFNNYRDLRDKDEWGPAGWPTLPYNAANGGPATRPSDFGTHPDCLRLYRQRLRYIVARWSAFTSIAYWEFFNEQSFSLANIPPEWTLEMARYLKSIDPYKHLVTTSFGNDAQRAVWESSDIDLTQLHLYPGDSAHDCSAIVTTSAYAYRQFNKPYLVGELGINNLASDIKFDPGGIGTNLHNGLWAGMMSGAAGGACNWWWDNYVRKTDLWHTYHGAAAFAAKIDWPNREFEPIDVPPTLSDKQGDLPETFSNILLGAGGGFDKHHGQTIRVMPNGQARLTLPQYIFGPVKVQMQTPTILEVDLPQATKMTIRVLRVSDFSALRVIVDKDPKVDFAISALPGAVDQEKVEQRDPGLYQAVINKDYSLDVPAGKHTIELKNIGGDWISIASVTFAGAKSSRYADLDVFALQDPSRRETLAWLRNQDSGWYNDLQGKSPRTIDGATMTIPVKQPGEYNVQWWDTRKGEVIREDRVTGTNGALRLQIPRVERDIALRAAPRDERAEAK